MDRCAACYSQMCHLCQYMLALVSGVDITWPSVKFVFVTGWDDAQPESELLPRALPGPSLTPGTEPWESRAMAQGRPRDTVVTLRIVTQTQCHEAGLSEQQSRSPRVRAASEKFWI